MKTPRQIAIADHLWEAFERMARDMGADREALVNQAMHVFARLNGFVVPGGPAAPGAETDPPPPLPRVEPRARSAAAEQVLAEAARLEKAIGEPSPTPSAAGGLLVVREDGTPLDVVKDRFVIGRGRECDLVIDSAKVSREHAAILRETDGWWIEDLGSSNGTWHHRERVSRKRIADGDEFFISSERIRCVLRP